MKSIVVTAFALILSMALPAYAQAPYPDRAISVVVPYAAGGPIDSIARPVADKLGKILGQGVVIVNRPGASGMIGIGALMHAKPDGYTLAFHAVSTMAIYSVLNTEKPDPNFPDLAIAAILASTPGVLSVASSLGVNNFRELVAKIKAEPGKHAWASPGVGTPSYLWSAQIVHDLGLDIQHVPFVSGAQAHTELIAGRVAWMFDTPVSSLRSVGMGKSVPVAVLAPTRLPEFPNAPTVGELGFPKLSNQMMAVYIIAPAGTPRDILVKLNAAYAKALQDPDLLRRMAAQGLVMPSGKSDVDGATALAKNDYSTWFEVAKAFGVKGQ